MSTGVTFERGTFPFKNFLGCRACKGSRPPKKFLDALPGGRAPPVKNHWFKAIGNSLKNLGPSSENSSPHLVSQAGYGPDSVKTLQLWKTTRAFSTLFAVVYSKHHFTYGGGSRDLGPDTKILCFFKQT